MTQESIQENGIHLPAPPPDSKVPNLTKHTYSPWVKGPSGRRAASSTQREKILSLCEKALSTETRIQVCCNVDIFEDAPDITPEWREDFWEIVRITSLLDWICVTKHPANVHRLLPSAQSTDATRSRDSFSNLAILVSARHREQIDEGLLALDGLCIPCKGIYLNRPGIKVDFEFLKRRNGVEWIVLNPNTAISDSHSKSWLRELEAQCERCKIVLHTHKKGHELKTPFELTISEDDRMNYMRLEREEQQLWDDFCRLLAKELTTEEKGNIYRSIRNKRLYRIDGFKSQEEYYRSSPNGPTKSWVNEWIKHAEVNEALRIKMASRDAILPNSASQTKWLHKLIAQPDLMVKAWKAALRISGQQPTRDQVRNTVHHVLGHTATLTVPPLQVIKDCIAKRDHYMKTGTWSQREAQVILNDLEKYLNDKTTWVKFDHTIAA